MVEPDTAEPSTVVGGPRSAVVLADDEVFADTERITTLLALADGGEPWRA